MIENDSGHNCIMRVGRTLSNDMTYHHSRILQKTGSKEVGFEWSRGTVQRFRAKVWGCAWAFCRVDSCSRFHSVSSSLHLSSSDFFSHHLRTCNHVCADACTVLFRSAAATLQMLSIPERWWEHICICYRNSEPCTELWLLPPPQSSLPQVTKPSLWMARKASALAWICCTFFS